MSCIVTETSDGRIIEIELSGKLTAEAYEQFMPVIEAKIKEFGKVRMLVILTDFHGWDVAALWEDMKFDMKHHKDIDRLALVGESKWEKGMSSFCRPFIKAEIKYFEKEELEAARVWIQE
ncbi:hypothetical protein Pla110_17230 [Polystyrenella longa]|uniref:STAS/SEC14 domain-containing protein n=1 Tax=Polystyrenella longa TaxID=2528007 RepID=A0A518CLA2_9PLAN|nr:STAS/SEC14 domain-containing protein [Polystyrenella longa]QDU80001.1 hypothetical protein Pla110_17230 [Polystyrenella longa]